MIGVFDSGVGGLTVVKEIFKYLPKYQIIYFGDTARLPYGTKGSEFVKRYSAKITKWLLQNNAKVIVIACNTSSAWAADFLKKQFPKTPVFEMISPAVKEALKTTNNKKIGIIGTPGTIKSDIYRKKLSEIDNGFKIYQKACPLLVPLVEEGWIENKTTQTIIKEYLTPLKEKMIDTLILGCTHYPLLKKDIEKIIDSGIRIINPAESSVRELKTFLDNNPKIASQIKRGKNHKFFFSDTPYNFKKISHLCFNKKIKIKIQDPF